MSVFEPGYECRSCGGKTCVKDSRSTTSGTRRRRECMSCGQRQTTYELVWPEDLGPAGRRVSNRVLLLERVLRLPPESIRSLEKVVAGLEGAERRIAKANRWANRWKGLARRFRQGAPQ